MSSNLFFEPQPRQHGVAGVAGLELAQWLAHELRNPLAPIATAAELLINQAGNEQARELGCIIERHAQHLRRLVDELVDVASRGRTWMDPLDPTVRSGQVGAVQLPLLFDPGTQPGTGLDADAGSSACLRILVVDDNADAAALLGQFLQSLGHDVMVVTDPLAAPAVALAFGPQVGLLDIAMPGMDGLELAGRLRQLPLAADLHLAAVTAYILPSDRQAAARAGFEQYFVKPLDVAGLQGWLSQLVQCVDA